MDKQLKARVASSAGVPQALYTCTQLSSLEVFDVPIGQHVNWGKPSCRDCEHSSFINHAIDTIKLSLNALLAIDVRKLLVAAFIVQVGCQMASQHCNGWHGCAWRIS